MTLIQSTFICKKKLSTINYRYIQFLVQARIAVMKIILMLMSCQYSLYYRNSYQFSDKLTAIGNSFGLIISLHVYMT